MLLASYRAKAIVGGICTVAVVLGLLIPSLLGGWGIFFHYACQRNAGSSDHLYAWVPALLINSPYGGEAFGNGTVPKGPLSPLTSTVYELGQANGSATWAGFRTEINLSNQENQTELGFGQGVRCSAPFAVSIQYLGGIVLGGPLLGSGNMSDVQEPTSLGYWTNPGDVNLTIMNGFVSSNRPSVSTCDKSEAQNYTASQSFLVRLPATLDGKLHDLTYSLPIVETFHYIFPGDFGTWQVDNLSAPGGPGGGWAFSYSPCP